MATRLASQELGVKQKFSFVRRTFCREWFPNDIGEEDSNKWRKYDKNKKRPAWLLKNIAKARSTIRYSSYARLLEEAKRVEKERKKDQIQSMEDFDRQITRNLPVNIMICKGNDFRLIFSLQEEKPSSNIAWRFTRYYSLKLGAMANVKRKYWNLIHLILFVHHLRSLKLFIMDSCPVTKTMRWRKLFCASWLSLWQEHTTTTTYGVYLYFKVSLECYPPLKKRPLE